MGDAPAADILRGAHVLVVDNDADSLDVLKTVLEYSGALVTVATSAPEALQKLESVIPDLAILDIEMPAQNGYDLLQQIRSAPDAGVRRIPAVAVTAYGSMHPAERTLHAGFDAHMSKPIDPWRLIDLAVRVISRRAPNPGP